MLGYQSIEYLSLVRQNKDLLQGKRQAYELKIRKYKEKVSALQKCLKEMREQCIDQDEQQEEEENREILIEKIGQIRQKIIEYQERLEKLNFIKQEMNQFVSAQYQIQEKVKTKLFSTQENQHKQQSEEIRQNQKYELVSKLDISQKQVIQYLVNDQNSNVQQISQSELMPMYQLEKVSLGQFQRVPLSQLIRCSNNKKQQNIDKKNKNRVKSIQLNNNKTQIVDSLLKNNNHTLNRNPKDILNDTKIIKKQEILSQQSINKDQECKQERVRSFTKYDFTPYNNNRKLYNINQKSSNEDKEKNSNKYEGINTQVIEPVDSLQSMKRSKSGHKRNRSASVVSIYPFGNYQHTNKATLLNKSKEQSQHTVKLNANNIGIQQNNNTPIQTPLIPHYIAKLQTLIHHLFTKYPFITKRKGEQILRRKSQQKIGFIQESLHLILQYLEGNEHKLQEMKVWEQKGVKIGRQVQKQRNLSYEKMSLQEEIEGFQVKVKRLIEDESDLFESVKGLQKMRIRIQGEIREEIKQVRKQLQMKTNYLQMKINCVYSKSQQRRGKSSQTSTQSLTLRQSQTKQNKQSQSLQQTILSFKGDSQQQENQHFLTQITNQLNQTKRHLALWVNQNNKILGQIHSNKVILQGALEKIRADYEMVKIKKQHLTQEIQDLSINKKETDKKVSQQNSIFEKVKQQVRRLCQQKQVLQCSLCQMNEIIETKKETINGLDEWIEKRKCKKRDLLDAINKMEKALEEGEKEKKGMEKENNILKEEIMEKRKQIEMEFKEKRRQIEVEIKEKRREFAQVLKESERQMQVRLRERQIQLSKIIRERKQEIQTIEKQKEQIVKRVQMMKNKLIVLKEQVKRQQHKIFTHKQNQEKLIINLQSKKRELKELEKEVKNKKELISTNQQRINQKLLQIQLIEQALKENQRILKQNIKLIKDKEDMLRIKQESIEQVERKIENKQSELQEVSNKVVKQVNKLSKMSELMNEREEQLKSKQIQFTITKQQREQQLREIQQKLRVKQQYLRVKQQQLSVKQQQLSGKQEQLSVKNNQLVQITNTIKQTDQTRSELQHLVMQILQKKQMYILQLQNKHQQLIQTENNITQQISIKTQLIKEIYQLQQQANQLQHQTYQLQSNIQHLTSINSKISYSIEQNKQHQKDLLARLKILKKIQLMKSVELSVMSELSEQQEEIMRERIDQIVNNLQEYEKYKQKCEDDKKCESHKRCENDKKCESHKQCQSDKRCEDVKECENKKQNNEYIKKAVFNNKKRGQLE